METLSFSHYQVVYNAVFFTITTLLAAFALRRGSGRDRAELIEIIQQG